MNISNTLILIISASIAFVGCSEGSENTSITQRAELIKQDTRVIQPTSTIEIQDSTGKDTLRKFDLQNNQLSATILRLGDVRLNADGKLTIFPTPSFQKGERVKKAWSYQTQFMGLGRQEISKPTLKSTMLNGNVALLKYESSTVIYEHRTTGLEQLIKIEKKPKGSGDLRVTFASSPEFKYKLSEDKKSVSLFSNEKLAFHWSNLVTVDAKGKSLQSSITLEDGKLVYVIDDHQAQYPIVVDPLANTPNTTLTGTADGEFGISAHGMGDVNNDGFDDIIVGEFEYTNGNTAEGRALIFLGSASGIQATATWSAEGGADYAKFGVATKGIGDVNGDGFDDFAIGAELDAGYFGRAYVFLGGAAVIPPASIFTAEASSPQIIESFGSNIAAGDYNCDGQIDLAVSAHLFDQGGGTNANWGRVFVFNGNSASVQLFDSVPTVLSSPGINSFFGSELETGNFNNDTAGGNSCDDLVIAGSRFSQGGLNHRGRVDIYFGATTGLANSDWSKAGDSTEARFGFGLGTGDVNNDGKDDLVVGAYHTDAVPGSASLFMGDTPAMMSTTAVWNVTGQAEAKFGRDVAIVDTDANSFGDILVTADDHIFAGGLREGAVFIYFNANGIPSTTPLWSETEGANADSSFGWKGGSAGDVNNDGFEDIFVTAFGLANSPLGHVYIYHGGSTCKVNGIIYQEGDVNPANPCEVCNIVTSTTSFSSIANGTTCDDADACTINEVCQAGACVGVVNPCNDNNECTDESCDPVMGCLFATAPMDGGACADDNESCTQDICANGVCEHPVANNSCMINNTCYAAGASDPISPCMQCNPAISKTAFSAATAGAICDDSLFCTTGETCNAMGQCMGAPRDCSSVNGACVATVECNETTDQCLAKTLETVGTVCNSGDLCNVGSCDAFGICNANNPVDCSAMNGLCTVGTCDPMTGMCAALSEMDGTQCNDGDACTNGTVCMGGDCRGGMAKDCSDGNTCTTDACNMGTCSSMIVPGSCLIPAMGGVPDMCIADGMLDPSNICKVCDSAKSPTTYSNVTAGTSCGATMCNAEETGVGESACDGNGGCIEFPYMDCGAYRCDPTLSSGAKCFTECLNDSQCEMGAKCSSDGVTPSVCITDKPAAVISGPTTAECSESLTLDASGSSDPNNLPLTFLWSQIEGPDVLNNLDTTQETLTIKLPDLLEMDTTFRFQVIVSNGSFDSDPQEWIVTGVSCSVVMEPGDDMGGDAISDMKTDMRADMQSDATNLPDGSDTDNDFEIRGSGCLCSSSAKYPTDASWILLLGFFGFLRRKKK